MNLDKAIEILTKLERTLAPTMAASGTDAIRLGIEALRAVKDYHGNPDFDCSKPLPGETEE
ncbi:hypothetical protein ES703_45065 [subsurface metagenome]